MVPIQLTLSDKHEGIWNIISYYPTIVSKISTNVYLSQCIYVIHIHILYTQPEMLGQSCYSIIRNGMTS